MSNVIKAVFGAGRKTKTRPMYQYDHGIVFKPIGINLPDVYEVHFSNYEYTNKAKPQLGDANGCVIPDEYFQTGQDIWAFIYLHTGEDDGETEYKTHIPIIARPQVDPSAPTPVQRDIIEQAIATLNTAVQKTAQDVVDADEYAQAAEQAKTDAVSAQEAAESAQSAAESAQEAAEAAQRAAGESSLSAKENADKAKSEADRAVSAVEHNPIIRNNYWWIWDSENDVYVDSGVVAIGQNGVSPYVDVVPIENGYQVVITDVSGTHSFILRHGEKGDAGRGIESTSYDPATDVLTLIFTDGTSFSTPSLRGATGNGIQSIEKTGTSGLVDTYTVTYTNGQTFTYTVTNGEKGEKGDAYVLTYEDKEEISELVFDMYVEEVEGTAPTIVAEADHRYICGTVLSLNFTPPASGITFVRFTAGANVVVLTLPQTVKMPDWFDVANLETNRIYEICITDGVYGSVMSWQL